MSITLKLVNLLDKLKVQNYFIEKDSRVYFTPIKFEFDSKCIENFSERLFRSNGKPYKMNEFEKNILNDLDI